jgi:hypothetical protein
MRRSRHTLLGRVHERVRLEAARDVEALYALLDPVLRARREEQPDEPERTRSRIRARVATIRSAEVVEVEILAAEKVCSRHGGRPAARVRAVVRYDDAPAARESTSVWVRERGVWYAAAPDA